MTATSPTNSSSAAAASSNANMMKEYLRKQLKYWIENFRDDMLPRDFGAKSFSRCTISLHRIELKMHKIGAMLQLPKPLLVTRAYCSEVSVKVPSWTAADKFVQEPLSLRVVDLFVDIKSAADCDDAYRQAYDARVQAAVMEPDPLGSIASMYAFATIVSERVELVVDNVYVKVFARGVSRVRVELANVHARTTNALWQDMRDLTRCVDRSPDGLLKTRFKFVSFSCSVLLTQSSESDSGSTTPLKVLRDHAVTMRMTLFGHRESKRASWETLSNVIDVNLHDVAFDYDVTALLHIYDVVTTVYSWLRDAKEHQRAASAAGAGLHQSLLLMQQQRAAVLPPHSDTAAASNSNDSASFALQLTVRCSATAMLRFDSERLGKQHIAFAAQHATVNVIVHHDGLRTLQVTVDEVCGRYQDRNVLLVKPARDALQLQELRDSVLVKWHLARVTCRLDGDLALVLNEMYHTHNEQTQSTFIKCGTCHKQVRLEAIATHVCSAAPSSVRSPTAAVTVASERLPLRGNNSRKDALQSNGVAERESDTVAPRLRLVFALDEFDLSIDSHLFDTVQQLMRSSSSSSSRDATSRTFIVRLTALSVTTESTEFEGDAIFVPVLPLAFQMLECTLEGCGCVRNRAAAVCSESHAAESDASVRSSSVTAGDADADERILQTQAQKQWLRWPERLFVELASIKCLATHSGSSSLPSTVSESRLPSEQLDERSDAVESFVVAEALRLCASFSDGVRVCANCHPQASAHSSVERVRCQLDDAAFQTLERALRDAASVNVVAQTLFLAVLEVQTIEFTLLQRATARLKSLFKHMSVVGDNQLGHLALQSSVDLRALLNSHAVRFVHRSTAAAQSSREHACSAGRDGSQQYRRATKQQGRRVRQEHERQCAARSIQRLARRLHPSRRQQVVCSHDAAASIERSPTTESAPSDVIVDDSHEQRSVSSADVSDGAHRNGSSQKLEPPQRPVSPKRKSSSSAAAALFSVPEDLLNANRKVVAAASVLTNFVKTKHQQLESEVVGLATQSKESAARLVLPPYSAYKKMFGLDSPSAARTGKTVTSSTQQQQQGSIASDKQEKLRVAALQASASPRSDSASSVNKTLMRDRAESVDAHETNASERPASSVHLSSDSATAQSASAARLDSTTRDRSSQSDCDEPAINGHAMSIEPLPNGANSGNRDEAAGALTATDRLESVDTEHDDRSDDEASDPSRESDDEDANAPCEDASQEFEQHEHGLSDALLEGLPSLVRVLVQVHAHRLCVPMNPRERVGFLCREVVRRFNELFAANRSACITHVALQDARGGVFAPTDIVGFVCTSERDVLFAVPRRTDERIHCVAHIEPSGRHEPARAAIGRRCRIDKALGSRFTRCSQLPLPLAIALLANENEHALLQCVLRDGSYGVAGDGHVDAWPELALNVSCLDPSRILPVEVRWFGRCLEVTNADAFVLCLQQLGLCTSRASSKYVGKVLRDRLKVDIKNPLIRSACLRSGGDFDIVDDDDVTSSSRDGSNTVTGHTTGRSDDDDERNTSRAAVSYESLKEIVQEDYGVYMTPSSA